MTNKNDNLLPPQELFTDHHDRLWRAFTDAVFTRIKDADIPTNPHHINSIINLKDVRLRDISTGSIKLQYTYTDDTKGHVRGYELLNTTTGEIICAIPPTNPTVMISEASIDTVILLKHLHTTCFDTKIPWANRRLRTPALVASARAYRDNILDLEVLDIFMVYNQHLAENPLAHVFMNE